jgi:hypothetical protein
MHHEDGSNTLTFSPSRLLYVGGVVPWDRPRLYETASLTMLKDKTCFHYVALSHCWGDAQITRTTKHNLVTFVTDGMEWSLLPNISGSHRVNPCAWYRLHMDRLVVYVGCNSPHVYWLRSDIHLGIIRDSSEDWTYEASLMHRVYSNAYLTIGASAALDGSQGLLNRHKVHKVSAYSLRQKPHRVHRKCILHPFSMMDGFIRSPITSHYETAPGVFRRSY